MKVVKLHRLTLVRKGRATPKHPAMRDGVVEVVKAEPLLPTTYDAAFDYLLHPDRQPTIHRLPSLSFDEALRVALHS